MSNPMWTKTNASFMKDETRLQHILFALSEIENYIASTESQEDFESNSMLVHACISQVEIIGEAASKISRLLKEENTGIDWGELVAFRNMLVHEYFRVDTGLLWDLVQMKMPKVEAQIQELFNQLTDSE